MPCQGAHGLGMCLAPLVRSRFYNNEPWHCAHGCSFLVHRALRPCAVRRHHGCELAVVWCPIRPWHCAHGFLSWLTAQGLGALVLAWRGGRLHQVPCRCSHGVHTTHVVEPMCACSSPVCMS